MNHARRVCRLHTTVSLTVYESHRENDDETFFGIFELRTRRRHCIIVQVQAHTRQLVRSFMQKKKQVGRAKDTLNSPILCLTLLHYVPALH